MPRNPVTAVNDDIYSATAVKGLFDRMSRSYERMNVIMSFGFAVRWRQQMLNLLPATHKPTMLLDAMSGMGETWSAIMRRYPNSTYSALDFSDQMIQHGRTRNARRFQNRFTLHHADMLDSHLPDGAFDTVVSAYGMKTFDPAQSARFAAELVRLLRPGGTFAFIEVTVPTNRILAALYMFYLSKIVPTVGVLLVSDPIEYRMLHRYLRHYGTGDHTHAALLAQPSLHVHQQRHFFGCATSWSGYRD